jgi:hypothetical protein
MEAFITIAIFDYIIIEILKHRLDQEFSIILRMN